MPHAKGWDHGLMSPWTCRCPKIAGPVLSLYNAPCMCTWCHVILTCMAVKMQGSKNENEHFFRLRPFALFCARFAFFLRSICGWSAPESWIAAPKVPRSWDRKRPPKTLADEVRKSIFEIRLSANMFRKCIFGETGGLKIYSKKPFSEKPS